MRAVSQRAPLPRRLVSAVRLSTGCSRRSPSQTPRLQSLARIINGAIGDLQPPRKHAASAGDDRTPRSTSLDYSSRKGPAASHNPSAVAAMFNARAAPSGPLLQGVCCCLKAELVHVAVRQSNGMR
jgi:hypothetical protein